MSADYTSRYRSTANPNNTTWHRNRSQAAGRPEVTASGQFRKPRNVPENCHRCSQQRCVRAAVTLKNDPFPIIGQILAFFPKLNIGSKMRSVCSARLIHRAISAVAIDQVCPKFGVIVSAVWSGYSEQIKGCTLL